MAEMRNFEADAAAWVGKHLPFHHDQHEANSQEQPQETRMTKLTDAKNAIDHAAKQLAAYAANPLADAIAEAAVGATLGPQDVALVVSLISLVEHGPSGMTLLGQAVKQQEPTFTAAQQQTSAQQLKPQQTA